MVLDAKALTWAAKNDIDTPKLKKARVPIYGKWYFPEIPGGVPLVNLETGEQQVFPDRMLAGEVIFVPAEDLSRSGLAPEGFSIRTLPVGEVAEPAAGPLVALAPEPLLAMARPPGLTFGTALDLVPVDEQQALVAENASELAGIHMPSASIAPFVLGVGFCILLLGIITNLVIVVVGLVWMVVGAVAWIRVGLLESAAADARAGEVEHRA